VIGPKAVGAVNELGVALLSPALKESTILLNGHTDAAGSPDYNLALSHRRAQSVRKYLIHTFKIPEDRLLVAGFGFERLKVADQPLSGENRRVEVVNTSN
jgi:outer membrane protein OmpA-like peptidoglycan-associated protein